MRHPGRVRRDETVRQRMPAVVLSLLPSLCLVSAPRAMAEDRSPAEILEEIDQVHFPEQDKSRIRDDDDGRERRSRYDAATEKRAALIQDF